MKEPLTYSIAEAAQVLGVAKRTLSRHTRGVRVYNGIPVIHAGNVRRLSRAAVDDLARGVVR